MKRVLTILSLAIFATTAQAHFPWLTVDGSGNVSYFFGENPADCTYKLPPAIAKAEIKMRTGGDLSEVDTKMIEADDFIGLKSKTTVPAGADLMSQTTFGVYHGARLDYYTQSLGGKMPAKFADSKPFANLDLQAHAVDAEGGVDVYVLWKGKPLADAEVQLFCEEGHEEGNGKTDAEGKVSFDDKEVEGGINGIMVGHTIPDEEGELDEQAYTSAMHYLTATFRDPEGR